MIWKGSILWLPTVLASLIAHPLTAQEQSSEMTIAYRLTRQATMHFDDTRTAEQHLQAVRKLGCEATRDVHGGHIDVTYRCPTWKSLTVKGEALAHQWQTWLRESGFETIHGHTAESDHDHSHSFHDGHDHGGGHQEQVSYRAAQWITLHPNRAIEAEEVSAIAKALGCDVRTSQHAGHVDLSIRCPQWKQAAFDSHEAAHGWEQWLKRMGFETRHVH